MLNKKNINNLILLVILGVILFTPVGTHIKNWLHPEEKINTNINLNTINLPLKGINTEDSNLKNLKGEVVFLNFFGTWCPPCVKEMPSIQKLYESKGKSVKFVLIPINDTTQKVNDFLSENKYTVPVYEANDVIDLSIKPNVFPTVLIFDKKGKLVLKEEGASDWNSQNIHALLDNLIAE